jgi:hypothetical protein
MNEEAKRPPRKWRKPVLFVAALLIAFLLGFVPMWFSAHQRAQELNAAQTSLRVRQMQCELASAAIDARRGEYEQARLAASSFFTAARDELDRQQGSAFSSKQQDALRALLAQRDELITLLARSDPASADRLSDLYVSFRNIIGSQPPR